MFMPKDRVFMNEIFDLVIENQRFISLPYYFPDTDGMEKSRKSLVKKKLKQNPTDITQTKNNTAITDPSNGKHHDG